MYTGNQPTWDERGAAYLRGHLWKEAAQKTAQKEEEKEPPHQETQTQTLHAQAKKVGLFFVQTLSQ